MHKDFRILLTLALLGLSTVAHSLEGLTAFEKSLFEKNQDIQSLKLQVEANEAQASSAKSNFYPSINLVGGWGHNKTDDLPNGEKGYLGYAEGRLNLFRGFKDQSLIRLKDNEYERMQNEFELKKRELRVQLVELASDMILLHKLENILKEEYKITQTQKQMAAKKVSAGLTSTVDNIEFELRESELQIEQRRITQAHLEAHQRIYALFGNDISDKELEALDFTAAETLMKELSPIKFEQTLEFKNATLVQSQAEFEKTEIKSEFLPSVDFTYSFGRLTPTENTAIKLDEFRYELLITIPLFSGFDTYYKTKAATRLSLSAERLKNQRRIEVTAAVNTAQTKLSELAALQKINEKKLASSQKYFELTLSEYKRGVKNSPDLVTATERWFSAKKQKYEILKELELLNARYERYK